MPRYHCPYCSPQDIILLKKKNKSYLCKKCGESLVRLSFFNINSILGLITAFSFTAPLLILMLYLIIPEINRREPKDNSKGIELVFLKNKA